MEVIWTGTRVVNLSLFDTSGFAIIEHLFDGGCRPALFVVEVNARELGRGNPTERLEALLPLTARPISQADVELKLKQVAVRVLPRLAHPVSQRALLGSLRGRATLGQVLGPNPPNALGVILTRADEQIVYIDYADQWDAHAVHLFDGAHWLAEGGRQVSARVARDVQRAIPRITPPMTTAYQAASP